MAFDKGGLPGRNIDVAELKRRIVLSDLVGETVDLRGRDGQWSGLCPFHDDSRPSLTVSDDVGLWHCHGCRAGGDAISFVMLSDDCPFPEAIERLARDHGGDDGASGRARISPGFARARRVEHAAAAQEIWRVAREVPGTPAERYLASRGIVGDVPPSLRFGRAPTWIDPVTGGGRGIRPALIAACQDVDGRIVGIHRTFLTEAGAKAPMEQPRLALGRIRGGAVRLGPERPGIMLCSGIEDGLALRLMFPGATVWVTPGDGNMSHVELPGGIRRVTVCGDADASGRAAVADTRDALDRKGIESAELLPKAGKDFNEEWLALHA